MDLVLVTNSGPHKGIPVASAGFAKTQSHALRRTSFCSTADKAEADETHVEESNVNTKRREPRRRRDVEHRVVPGDESESEISEEEEEQQEIVNGGEEEEADDEASDMEEQELGECRYVVTRKRGRTQKRGNDTQGE
jgi:hypothetical protein